METDGTEERALDVDAEEDVVLAREAAREVAEETGFDPDAVEEIAIAATELATNLQKHARKGSITVTRITRSDGDGVRIRTLDEGPGLATEQGLTDGYSTTGTLGQGLGAVNRLMDTLEITPREDTPGTLLAAERFIDPADDHRPSPVAIGAATRARPGGDLNGDSFVVEKWDNAALVAVIDGLGHGQFAHTASRKARAYLEDHYDRPVRDLFRGVGRACRGTRGVVMAVARFDWTDATVTFGSVGNVSARVLDADDFTSFPVRRGVLGNRNVSPAMTTKTWDPEYTLVLHSDGVSTRWTRDALPRGDADAAARAILTQHGKEGDDATVLVVKGAPQ